ncbi:MAG TPA: hypothetical protein VHD34_00025 [Xanthobacteraceae bacterium]|nr:hypothetical protein [Xanthobacteraceae bacterium]
MKKVIVAAAALALTASVAAVPTKAHAFAWWLLPVINGAVDMGTLAIENGGDRRLPNRTRAQPRRAMAPRRKLRLA